MSPRLLAPLGSGGCSFEGEEYQADEMGTVDVPDEAVATLSAHGFTGYTDPVVVPDEAVGEYTIKHAGRGKYKVFKGDEEVASGLTKPDAEAEAAALQSATPAPPAQDAPEAPEPATPETPAQEATPQG